MADYIVTCHCGCRIRVSEFAVGATGRCPRCGTALTISEADLEPVAEKPPAAPPPSAETTGTGCARCGRAFRGEWDRYPTDYGVLCHICARLATDDAPLGIGASVGASGPATDGLPGRQSAEVEAAPESKPTFTQRHPDLVRRTVLAAGLMVIAIGLYYAIVGGPEYDVHSIPRVSEPPDIRYPLFWAVVVVIVKVLLGGAGTGLTLYLVLDSQEKLPNDTLGKNVLALGVVGLGLFAATTFLGFIPCVGFILAIILTYLVICDFYGARFFAFFLFLLLHGVCHFLVYLAGMFLFGLLAWIARL